MFTLEKKYHLRKKVFWYFFFFKNKVMHGILLAFLVLVYVFLFGPFVAKTNTILEGNIYFIDISLLRLWASLFVLSYIVIIFLRASVLYRVYSYVFHKHSFHVSHGIFFVKEHVMPYSQIINVEIRKSIITYLFGLVEVDIITGLTEEELGKNKYGKRISLIPVIDKNTAQRIAHKLMSQAAVHNGYEDKDLSRTEAKSAKKRRRR